MDKKLIGILAGGVLVMAVTAWWVAKPPPAPVLPETQRRFMHCASCGREVRYDAKHVNQDCPYCGEKGPMIVTAVALRKAGPPQSAIWRIVPPLLVELTILAGVLYGYAVLRSRQAAEEEPSYPLFCRHCHRKMRYRKSQGGRLGKCPGCRQPVVFPKAPEAVKQSWPNRVWQKLMGTPHEPSATD